MRSSRELAADTGGEAELAALKAAAAERLVAGQAELDNGALATANTAEPARTAGITAKRIARLTLAAAKASSSA